MDFIRAQIDGAGYIKNDDGGLPYGTIHRETRRLQTCCVTFNSIVAAKKAHDKDECALVAKLTDEGGIDTLYCFSDEKDEVAERLEYWKGCYGKWPLRTMSR